MMPLHKDGHAGGKRPRHRTPALGNPLLLSSTLFRRAGTNLYHSGDAIHPRIYAGMANANGTRYTRKVKTARDCCLKISLNRNIVPMSGELGTVWIMHFDMVHSFLQNYVPLNRYGMKFVFMRTEQPTAPSWNSETSIWQPPKVNHVPYDAEILWTYIWNWMYGKTDSV